jgi:hypothetical protein
MAKNLKVIPLSLKEANQFVTKHHRHNKNCRFTLEINRNCVLNDAPKGTCSFLYAKAIKIWQSMGGKKIITYTLTTESGSSLKAVNFNNETKVQTFKKNTGWTTRANRVWQEVQAIPRIRWVKEL